MAGTWGQAVSLQGTCPCPGLLTSAILLVPSVTAPPCPPFLHGHRKQRVRGSPQQPQQHPQTQGMARARPVPAPSLLAQAGQAWLGHGLPSQAGPASAPALTPTCGLALGIMEKQANASSSSHGKE